MTQALEALTRSKPGVYPGDSQARLDAMQALRAALAEHDANSPSNHIKDEPCAGLVPNTMNGALWCKRCNDWTVRGVCREKEQSETDANNQRNCVKLAEPQPCQHDWSNVDSDGSVWPMEEAICRRCGKRKGDQRGE